MGNEGGIETMEPFAAAVPPWRLGVRGVGVQPRRGDVCNFAMELLPDLVTRSTSEDSQPHFESFGRVVHFCGRIILERPEVFVLDIGLPVMLSSFGIPNGLANSKVGMWFTGEGKLSVSALPISMLDTPDAITLERSWRVLSSHVSTETGVSIVVEHA